MERRLVAILVADVAGYSRLMEADEEATASALNAQREIVESLVSGHHGRLFGAYGDSFIAEFASPVEAVRCAVEIQREFETRNAERSEDRRMRLRIGINLCDVMVDGDNLLGDGVNIAARLESLADPGSITLAQSVYDQVRKQPGLECEFLGEHEVKNITEPLRVYRVAMGAGQARVIGMAAQASRPMTMAAFIAMLMLLTGTAIWLQRSGPEHDVAVVENMAYPLPDKPSIAVLPFANMSGNPEQEYFTNGITDDLITDLSKVSGLFVVARNSVFVYKGMSVNIASVAEALGVRYVLEGSVRRDGNRVRVNAQLIDATTGGHLWADRYDGDIEDIFAVQDDFVGKIVRALEVSLKPGEQDEASRGETRNIAAREAFQKGWEHYLNYTPDENAQAIQYLEEAIGLDPEYGKAYAALSLVFYKGCGWGWNKEMGLTTGGAASKAMYYKAKSDEYPTSFGSSAASQINLYFSRFEDAFSDAARAIALDPNDPEGYLAMAWSLMTSGNPEASVELVERAVRLNPGYPYHYVFTLGIAYIATGEFQRAADVLQDIVDKDVRATG
ncbi:MAG: adenylate/guanylate cyclase domain-containing protein [Alphaproteobacteria bacterium]